MPTPLAKLAYMDHGQLRGMVAYAAKNFPFLEYSSEAAVVRLCHLMVHNPFMFDIKPTPIRSSLEFLRKLATVTPDPTVERGHEPFVDRDFIFAIKAFGLGVRRKNGVLQFVASGQVDHKEDEEVLINDAVSVKQLEFYVSDVQKHTKIQTNAIESATNRLLREWREVQLAINFSQLVVDGSEPIGKVREMMRNELGIKDHEYVRIRALAISMGLFKSKRNQAEVSRRITLDEDIQDFVLNLRRTLAPNKKPLTTSQAVNMALRNLRDGLLGTKPLTAKVEPKKTKTRA